MLNPSLDDLATKLQAMTTNNTISAATPATDMSEATNLPPLINEEPPSQQALEVAENTQPYAARPQTPRSQTDPSPDMFSHPRPRNRSPYSRSHFRSHSGSSTLSAPPMMRAHSLPTVISSAGHLSLSPSPIPFARPSSPLRSPKRTRSPFRSSDEQYIHSGAPSVCDISEDAELELKPNAGGVPIIPGYGQPTQSSPLGNIYNSTNSLPRANRRRPASPLCHVSVPFGTAPMTTTPTSSVHSSPLLAASKFNEPFPGANAHYPSSLASSSVPSTPTSLRSRSPSISSLETIPDIPDAEAEAIEADRIAKLKAAAEKEERGEDDEEPARRSSLDVPGSGRSAGFGKRDSRKRWSVCGAERRGDLDLETIWED
ncbi:hypothetical protein GQ43DRAFT_448703 [Delitschia confertaspora ATCC 74209]|uniref:Basic proline-rich protein n=1 Tax=Delitschia confertaspora ATCC 74209 TaxID=1513339 RepID=A0A9P4JLB5_9PLEO|nr:hypothetical protein GQ43DRAFT_448703 [Delitschia confertaspora ATCC 74209]